MLLDAKHMRFEAGGRVILDDVSLSVGAGELVGLIGPNGAGKSSLLKAILGLLDAASGEVALSGDAVPGLSAREQARRMAYLPQEREVGWPLTGENIVMLGRYPYRRGFGGPSPACRAAVSRAIADVDAGAFADRPFTVLSGGERTRILLARALAVDAPLLLADEPVAALDPGHQLQVMALLKKIAGGGTGILAVMHDLTLASRFMQRLVLLHEGRVVADGPPGEVLSDGNLARVYGISARHTVGALVPWESLAPSALDGGAKR